MGTDRAGRTAVITGGGRGFGKGFGEALAAEGAHVVLVDIDGGVAEEAAAEIRAKGQLATGLGGDITDEARMAEVMAQAAALQGGPNAGIDILINNAGLHSDEYGQPITKMGLAKTRRLFEVNVIGTIACTLAAWPHMKGRVGASMVNISSSAAHMGGSAYGDTKLAVAGLTITFGRELAPDGIRVNAISPGLMLTETIKAELPAETMQRVKAMQWLEEDGRPEHIVDAMLFLTSDKARFITGEVLRVTGGMAAGV